MLNEILVILFLQHRLQTTHNLKVILEKSSKLPVRDNVKFSSVTSQNLKKKRLCCKELQGIYNWLRHCSFQTFF